MNSLSLLKNFYKTSQVATNMAIKKGDFVAIDYIGKLATTGAIFDLTDAELAKKEGIFNPQQKYGPVTICVGESMLVRGIDAFLEGKEAGKEYELDVEPDQGFGPRVAKLIQLVSIKKFKDHELNPYPGARVMIDNLPATIRSISGGRVLVDFNHSLAGKKLHYWIKINKIVTSKKEQASSLLERFMPTSEFSVEVKEIEAKKAGKKKKILTIKLKNKAQFKPLVEKIQIDIRRLIKGVEKVKIE